MIQFKEITLLPKDPIEGAVYLIKFAKQKSKEYGELDVVLKCRDYQTNLMEFKDKMKYNDIM